VKADFLAISRGDSSENTQLLAHIWGKTFTL
jgi:hypothetical protein